DYALEKDLIWIAINGIASIFELQTPTPKHDFCRLFAKGGLLEPLSFTLSRTVSDPEPVAYRYTVKIVHLFLIFSQADSYVKEVMGTSMNIVGCLLHELQRLPMDLSIVVLKCIRNLSMNPTTLETLERAKAIEILTEFLTSKNAIGATEICNQVLNTLYNLCRINKHRQELAAQAGIIPHLQQIVAINSPLKQFALPVLCDMAHAGKVCRRLLWKNHGLQFYLGLLRDPNWQTNGLEAILVWLQEDAREVEAVLVEATHLDILVRAFVYPRNNTVFEGLIGPLPKIIRLSPRLAQALAQRSKFIGKLLERLVGHPKALIRLNLLKILKSLLDQGLPKPAISAHFPLHPTPSGGRCTIQSIVRSLAIDDPAILVREMAKELVLKHFAA
ncbi:Protein kinase of the Mitotic Exit Network, partial [Massospora cicadina]